MKRIMNIVILLIILIFIVGCNESNTSESNSTDLSNNTNSFVVELKRANSEECSYDTPCQIVPLVKIIKGLGGEINWENDYYATVEFKGKEYTLDTKARSFKAKGTDNELMLIAPGGHPHYDGEKEEFCIGRDVALLIFDELNIESCQSENSNEMEYYIAD